MHDAGPALQGSWRFETAVLTTPEREGAIERLRDGVQRRPYSPRVLQSMQMMATRVMVAAILRLGEKGPQRS
jgi:hypothetical protein